MENNKQIRVSKEEAEKIDDIKELLPILEPDEMFKRIDKMRVKFRNKEKLQEYCNDTAYMPVYGTMEDIVMTLYLPLKENSIHANIPEDFIKHFEMDKYELFAKAIENTRKEDDISLNPIGTVLNSLLGIPMLEKNEDIFYVLTNQNGNNGARVILYKETFKLMKAVFKEKEKVWAIPSSIHEWLVLPNMPKSKENYDKLLRMLRSVNREAVMEKEWLSDNNIYEFNLKEETFKPVERFYLSD